MLKIAEDTKEFKGGKVLSAGVFLAASADLNVPHRANPNTIGFSFPNVAFRLITQEWTANENGKVSKRHIQMSAWLLELSQFDEVEWSRDEIDQLCVTTNTFFEMREYEPEHYLQLCSGLYAPVSGVV